MTKYKFLLPIAILLFIAFLTYSWVVGFNNKAILLKEESKECWGNVESSYQRRNDLIGNLVKTVQGAASFEKSTLVDVISARSKATQITIDPTKATPEQIETFQKSQSGVSSALSRLLVSVEKYPELKANENFLKLQVELEGTENRIKIARDRYNESINPYNVHILSFPNSILSGFFKFTELPYYKSDSGSEKAPSVDFKF